MRIQRCIAAVLLLCGSSVGTKIFRKPHNRPAPPAQPALLRDAAACNSTIPGVWTGFESSGPLYDEYSLQWVPGNPPGVFSAVMIRGGGWTLGNGNIDFSAGTATINFDTGVFLAGSVSSDCKTFMWNNTSVWRAQSNIDVVHIIGMNHLDVGYNGIPLTGFINNILNIYFATYFPRAIAISQALRELGGSEQFIYTTHAWLAHLYMHCPANMTLSGITLICPTPDAVAAFKLAVQQGMIAIQAAAFNSEYEVAMTSDMIDVHFALAKAVADEIGIPHPVTASLRDVPGTTRSLIPHLVRNNITALSIGVNSGTASAVMPNPGVWHDPATNTSVLYLQHDGGYPNNPGPNPLNPGGMSAADCVTFPGFTHALCWAFRTDNSGPPESVDEVLGYFEIARYQFPGAEVYASTYDNFTSQLAGIRDQLPVVSHEVGDIWVMGVPSDPWKNVWYREASRTYSDCLSSGVCNASDPAVLGFTRMAIKLPEHTWGLPSVNDNSNWTNVQFHAALEAGVQTYVDCASAWQEQRDIAQKIGMASLGSHPLAANITKRFAALFPPHVPSPASSGYVLVPPSEWTQTFGIQTSNGLVNLQFDTATGALSGLEINGQQWADASHRIGLYKYRTYNESDWSNFTTCCFGQGDAQKIANPQQLSDVPVLRQLYQRSGATSGSFLAQMDMDPLAVFYYGAPAQIWINYTVNDDASVSVTLQLFNKTNTRLAEAHFFSFMPAQPSGGDFVWMMDKLGGMVDPLNVTTNGNHHQHGVATGVYYTSASDPTKAFVVESLDVPIVSPSTATQESTILPVPLTPMTGPVTSMDFILIQIAYNTNYLLFSLDENFSFRFTIRAAI